MSNTLLILVTHFLHSLNIKESKKKILCTSFMDNDLKLREQNQTKKTMRCTLETIFKWPCYVFF